MPSVNKSSRIRGRLKPVRRALIRSDIKLLFWRIYSSLLGLFLFALIGERIFYWSATLRYGMWVLGLVLVIAFVLAGIGISIATLLDRFPRYRWSRLAERWGRIAFEHPDTVLNAYQLETTLKNSQAPDLSHSYIVETESRLGQLDPGRIQDHASILWWKRTTALVLGIVLMILAVDINANGSALYRWIHPRTAFRAPAPFALGNITGDLHVLGGDPVQLDFRAGGALPDSVYLELQSTTPETADSLPAPAHLAAIPDSNGYFNFLLKDIYRDYHYRAVVPAKHFWEAWSKVATPFHFIQVTDRPSVKSLTFTIMPPLYSRLSPESQEGNMASIRGLKGSRVAVQLESNRPLAFANLVFGGNTQDLNVRGRRATGEFTLVTPDTVSIRLKDQRGITNANPIPYVIEVLPDQYPNITVRSPEAELNLGDDLLIPLELELEDDFGFSGLQLVYSVQHPGITDLEPTTSIFSVSGVESDRTTQVIRTWWDVNDIPLLPEDELHFHFELFDNDNISGPKKTTTGEFVAKLPSIDDLFQDMESQENDLTDSLNESVEDVKNLQEQLDKMNLELVKSEDVSWDQKQEAQKQLEEFKKQAQALKDMSETLQAMSDLDQKHQLFSDELRKKFDELQNMVSDLVTEDMLKKIDQVEKDLDSISLDDLKKAVADLSQNADQIEEQLDRFLDLFKRVQAEQKMDELSKRLESLVKEQTSLEQKVEQTPEDADPSDLARLTEDERRVNEDWKQAKSTMQDAADLVREYSPQTAAQLEAMQQSESAEAASENLQSTMQNLKNGSVSQASQSASQARQNLSDLMQQAGDMQQSFQQQTSDAMAAKFKSIMRDLLSLSKSQEQLREETQSTATHSSRFREMASRQQVLKDQLMQAMSKLMQLSKETFAVSPEMGKAMGMASAQMEGAKEALTNRNRNGAAQNQKNAMASLNQGARAMGNAANQMQQGGSASGFEQFLQRMQAMSGQQQALNNQGLPLLMGSQGASLRQQMMQRMLSGQQGIRKSLQQLMQEMQSSGQHSLGDMGGMANEMDEVIKDLQNHRYTRKTKMRQEQILSRMLDSQKSLTQRGKKDTRKSKSAAQMVTAGPGGLPADLGQRQSVVMDALNDALQAGYPADYQAMIRRYFNSLNSKTLPGSDQTNEESE